MYKYTFSNTKKDLSAIFCGFEVCEKGHRFGPHVRDCYLIHFCLAGKGKLWDKYGEHKISEGQLFVIRPGEVTVYEADKNSPWEYGWIGFHGTAAQPFLEGDSVYSCPMEMLSRVRELYNTESRSPELYLSVLYELLSRLFYKETNTDSYGRISSVRRYIRYNYMYNVHVSDLARTFGFERSYLYRMFKTRYGVSVKEFLTTVRMEQAKTFLAEGYPVNVTAHMVGYEDEFNFSKTFKKFYGYPPAKEKEQSDNKA
ncbi:MAG: AraC family transcriptional regulator [Clostridia bacterium]|nr:AraC family transcriptional regulator [Clostridia bacterium]MBQ1943056.1 AraC family transcriptional regulator [Clostridia bacterium]